MGYRPYLYRVGQRRAIDLLGIPEMDKNISILDVGCGIGTGLKYFSDLGFWDVVGIDTDEERVNLALRRGLNVFNMDMEIREPDFQGYFEMIWSSHSLEHSKNPTKVLEILKFYTWSDALFFFILPYPDTEPAELHTASRELGLDILDDGKTTVKWFEDRGMELLHIQRDSFREPELWLKFRLERRLRTQNRI